MVAQAFDELGPMEACRPPYAHVRDWLAATSPEAMETRRREAEFIFRRTGITFAVYTEGGDPERLIPFDVIPRVIDGTAWDALSRGQAKLTALACLLAQAEDYAEQRGEWPVIALDDLASELDRTHQARVLERLLAGPAQIFVTATETPAALQALTDITRFHVEHGQIVAVP